MDRTPVNDIQELIKDARGVFGDFVATDPRMGVSPNSPLDYVRRLADALEALNRENEELAQGMTTEWGVGLGDIFMTQKETREDAEFAVQCRGDMDFRLMKRLVGPWVEVSS